MILSLIFVKTNNFLPTPLADCDLEVVELISEGRAREPFTDYQEFVISHDELRQILKHPEANREWQARLSAVAGVYLKALG